MNGPQIGSQAQTPTTAVRGPAAVGHQVRELSLRVEALPNGALRVSTESARGWAAVVRTSMQLTAAIQEAFTEAQVAAYARAHGQRYDLDELTDPIPGDPLAPPRARPRRRRNNETEGWGMNQRRPDTLDPTEWVLLSDGRWQSPGGQRWRPESQMAQRVVARRKAEGLPVD